MSTISYKERLKSYPLSKKLIAIGAALLWISALLPWYSDIDRYKTGDLFLGITGPLYLVGFLVLASATFSLIISSYEFLGRDLPKMPLDKKYIHISSISISALMIMLAASVYFHPKFGINISEKSVGIGMISSIFSLLIMIAAIAVSKNEKIFVQSDRHHESLLNIGLEETKEQTNNTLNRPDYSGQYESRNVQVPGKDINAKSERFSYFSGSINNPKQ